MGADKNPPIWGVPACAASVRTGAHERTGEAVVEVEFSYGRMSTVVVLDVAIIPALVRDLTAAAEPAG